LFVLSPTRIEVEGRGVGDVLSRVIRNNSDVIAYFVLHRVPFERRKRSAHGDVRRPYDVAVRAERIEEL
jgi:hypothetical protein